MSKPPIDHHSSSTYAGYVAILGRPNVGKSTLLNRLLGKKISITARKAQTTRDKILGIKTSNNYQTIYVDTPGIHLKSASKLNQHLNQVASHTIHDVDLILFMVAGTIWQEEDEHILELLRSAKVPVVLVINKVDLLPQKTLLLKHIATLSQKYQFTKIMMLSAAKDLNFTTLEQLIHKLLPVNPFFFPATQKTDRNKKFLVAEIIREKLTRLLGQELPYAVSVVVEQLLFKKDLTTINATIYVERRGQKIIVIGEKGKVLKKVGSLARHDIEQLLKSKVFLQLWVKIKPDWTNNERVLRQLGYSKISS